MKTVREVIVVEGRYDKTRLESAVNAVILPVDGFRIFRDREKIRLLRELAAARGVILLTDSDTAGFVIRNHLTGVLPPEQIKQAFIPPVEGKERRKTAPGKEGLLGVEGMTDEVLIEALRRAGATFEDGENPPREPWITRGRLYADGLIGRDNSAKKRRALLRGWGLPEQMSTNRLLETLNLAKTPAEYEQALAGLEKPEKTG
ncbi:MAG: toprim domain-containing protein [Acutalibacteraceae bacterium]|jgi:ribonuclease M5